MPIVYSPIEWWAHPRRCTSFYKVCKRGVAMSFERTWKFCRKQRHLWKVVVILNRVGHFTIRRGRIRNEDNTINNNSAQSTTTMTTSAHQPPIFALVCNLTPSSSSSSQMLLSFGGADFISWIRSRSSLTTVAYTLSAFVGYPCSHGLCRNS